MANWKTFAWFAGIVLATIVIDQKTSGAITNLIKKIPLLNTLLV